MSLRDLAFVGGLLVAGCARKAAEDQACFEARVAMGARLEECAADTEAGLALMDALEDQRSCQVNNGDPRLDTSNEDVEVGLFECAFVLRNLACELAVDYGADPAPWLASHPVCELLWSTP